MSLAYPFRVFFIPSKFYSTKTVYVHVHAFQSVCQLLQNGIVRRITAALRYIFMQVLITSTVDKPPLCPHGRSYYTVSE